MLLAMIQVIFNEKAKKLSCATAAQGVIEEQEAGHEELRYKGYTQCPSALG